MLYLLIQIHFCVSTPIPSVWTCCHIIFALHVLFAYFILSFALFFLFLVCWAVLLFTFNGSLCELSNHSQRFILRLKLRFFSDFLHGKIIYKEFWILILKNKVSTVMALYQIKLILVNIYKLSVHKETKHYIYIYLFII